MPEYLIFQLAGPFASWGDVAPGETRNSYRHPSKSAVLGLVAGALGLKREQEEELQSLNRSLGFAAYWHQRFGPLEGREYQSLLLEDYHTSQVDPADKKFTLRTRADELSGPKDNRSTILSTRQYLNDAYARVALWKAGEEAVDLGALAVRLKAPVFAPYLGRKACSPSLPFSPWLGQAKELLEAFLAYPAPLLVPPGLGPATLLWEDRGTLCRVEPTQRLSFRDALVSRTRWQYEPLTLCSRTLEE